MNHKSPNVRNQVIPQPNLPVVLGGTLLLGVAFTGCGGDPSDFENVEVATTERAAISDYDVCIKTKDQSNAGTSDTMTLSFYDSSGEWAAKCDIAGIGRGDTKCCTLSTSYANSNWDCDGDGKDQFGIDHTDTNSAHVTRVEVYRNGSLHRRIDDFFCEIGMGSCKSYIGNAAAQYGWFKTGHNQEKKVIVNLQENYLGDPYGRTFGKSMSGCLVN